jgi:toxin HigB-1
MAITSFAYDGTVDVALGRSSKASRATIPTLLANKARERLVLLDAAHALDDLAAWPSLRLEKLRGDRSGQYSIRINDQYRICFWWRDGDAHDVEIVDYH